MELWQYDATDLARLIRTGRASAKEAVDSVLGRLHKVNPAINAVVRVYEDQARAEAETADAARARGHASRLAIRARRERCNKSASPVRRGACPAKCFARSPAIVPGEAPSML